MLWGTLGGSVLENLLAGKGIVWAGSGNKKEKELQELALEKIRIFMLTHPLTNFEIQRYYQNKS